MVFVFDFDLKYIVFVLRFFLSLLSFFITIIVHFNVRVWFLIYNYHVLYFVLYCIVLCICVWLLVTMFGARSAMLSG